MSACDTHPDHPLSERYAPVAFARRWASPSAGAVPSPKPHAATALLGCFNRGKEGADRVLDKRAGKRAALELKAQT
jgi:hypothetical protein